MIPDTQEPWSYPRETLEYVPFSRLTVDGVTPSAFEYAITPMYGRPTTFTTGVFVDGVPSFLLNATLHGVGRHKVWVRVTSDQSPERPVIEAGIITIT